MASYYRPSRPSQVVAVLVAVFLTNAADAQTIVNSSWTGPASGTWFANGNWSPTGAPNNTSNTQFAVTINQPATVSVGVDIGSFTVDSLNLAAATSGLVSIGGNGFIESLTITNQNSAGITLAANNTIRVLSTGTLFLGTTVDFSGSLIQGAGTVNLTGGKITNTTANVGLTNSATINGTGSIGNSPFAGTGDFILDNQAGGLIDANSASNNLGLFIRGASSNEGTFQAESGGTLTITYFSSGTSIINSGAIAALDGSNLNINGSGGQLVGSSGGQLMTAGTGQIVAKNLVFNGTGAAVVNAGALQITGIYSTNAPADVNSGLQGTLTNNGTITFDTSTGTDIFLNANATLNGSGTFTMTDVSHAGQPDSGTIRARTAGATLTNASTINGSGSIGDTRAFGNNTFGQLTLINQATGVINANVSSTSLAVYPGGSSTNAGTLEASNGGTLVLASSNVQAAPSTLTNTGTITALDGSTVMLLFDGFFNSPLTIAGGVGGQFTTSGTGVIVGSNGVILDGTTSAIVNAGAFQSQSTRIQGTITNNGTISVPSVVLNGGNPGLLVLTADATLNGSGTVTLAVDASGNRAEIAVFSNTNAQTLTNATTINGAGNIGGDP